MEDPNGRWPGVFTFLFVVASIQVGPMMALFLLRRKHHPITGHSLTLVTAFVVGMSLATLPLCLIYMNVAFPCWVYTVFGYGGVIVAVISFIMRAWRVVLFYSIQSQKITSVFASGTIQTTTSDTDKSLSRKSISNTSGDQTPPVEKAASQPTLARVTSHARLPSINMFTSVKSLSRRSKSTGSNAKLYEWFTERTFSLVAFGFSLLGIVGVCIPLFVGGPSLTMEITSPDTADLCPLQAASESILVGCVGTDLIVICFTIWKLRKVYDGYMIKDEMKWQGLYGLIILITMIGTPRFGDHRAWQTVKLIGMNLVIFQIVSWKVIISFRRKPRVIKSRTPSRDHSKDKEKAARSRSDVFTLGDVLADVDARILFIEHLKREWSVENLLFYEAVQSYRALWKTTLSSPTEKSSKSPRSSSARSPSIASRLALPPTLSKMTGRALRAASTSTAPDNSSPVCTEKNTEAKRQAAIAIFATFIADDSPSTVNLPSTILTDICTQIQAVSPAPVKLANTVAMPKVDIESGSSDKDQVSFDLYDAAAVNIYNLMSSDSFSRFRTSQLFLDFVESGKFKKASKYVSKYRQSMFSLSRVFRRLFRRNSSSAVITYNLEYSRSHTVSISHQPEISRIRPSLSQISTMQSRV